MLLRRQGQLPGVESEVPAGVGVDLLHGHRWGEKRIPAVGEIRSALQRCRRFGRQPGFQCGDGALKLEGHAPVVVHGSRGAGAEVIDWVEQCGSGIEQTAEGRPRRWRATHQHMHQGQQCAHNHVPENHMEQQLLIGPPSAVAAPFQVAGVRRREEAAQHLQIVVVVLGNACSSPIHVPTSQAAVRAGPATGGAHRTLVRLGVPSARVQRRAGFRRSAAGAPLRVG